MSFLQCVPSVYSFLKESCFPINLNLHLPLQFNGNELGTTEDVKGRWVGWLGGKICLCSYC